METEDAHMEDEEAEESKVCTDNEEAADDDKAHMEEDDAEERTESGMVANDDDDDDDEGGLGNKLADFYEKLVRKELSANRSSFMGIPVERLADAAHSHMPLLRNCGADGVFVDGIPLHHHMNKALTSKQRALLKENGVELLTTHFSGPEDRQIRRNWKAFRRFAGKEDLPDASIVFSRADVKNGRRKGKVFRRAYLLFHPGNEEEGGVSRPWTAADVFRLGHLVGKYGHKWERIGAKLKRPRWLCTKKYNELQSENQLVEDEVQWMLLYKQLRHCFGVDPVVVAALKSKHLKPHMAHVDWTQIHESVRELHKEMDTEEPAVLARALPSPCRQLSKMYRAKRAKDAASGAAIADAIDVFLSHDDEELDFAKRGANHMRHRFVRCKALTQHDENRRRLLFRQIYGLLKQFEMCGAFKNLPTEVDNIKGGCWHPCSKPHTFLDRLRAISYVLRQHKERRLPERTVLAGIQCFLKTRGFK